MAGGKRVVVDAKVAFVGYLEAMEAREESTRAARLKAHARHLRTHIDSLADKAYWERFDPTPEFVVCFVPADAFLNAALEQEPGLLEHAFARNVVVATPSTLIRVVRRPSMRSIPRGTHKSSTEALGSRRLVKPMPMAEASPSGM